MPRWHERREPENKWAQKGKKARAANLAAVTQLYGEIPPSPEIKPGHEPAGIVKSKARKSTKAKNLPVGDISADKDGNGLPVKPKRKKREKDPFHERYEQHVVVAYNEKRGLPCFAIPNGSRRTLWEAMEAKRSGMKSGVMDLCYPVPMQGFGGLFIEMKRREGGVVSPMQKYWIALLRHFNYRVEVAEGAPQAIEYLEDYFKGFTGIPDDIIQMLQAIFDAKKLRKL